MTPSREGPTTRVLSVLVGVAVGLTVLSGSGCAAKGAPRASLPPPPARVRPAPAAAIARLPELGIEVVGLHITAGGNLVDFRYRVLDPHKAALLLNAREKPVLMDLAHGLRLSVPTMAYVGALRQTSIEPEAGKTYFILFGNAARSVVTGSRVTLVIGESRIEDLVVM